MIDLDIIVIVPRLTFTVPDLHETDTALDETAGDQNLPRLRPLSVHRADMCRFARDVEGVSRIHLHAIGELEGLDAGFELGIGRATSLMFGIELRKQIELRALFRERNMFVA